MIEMMSCCIQNRKRVNGAEFFLNMAKWLLFNTMKKEMLAFSRGTMWLKSLLTLPVTFPGYFTASMILLLVCGGVWWRTVVQMLCEQWWLPLSA